MLKMFFSADTVQGGRSLLSLYPCHPCWKKQLSQNLSKAPARKAQLRLLSMEPDSQPCGPPEGLPLTHSSPHTRPCPGECSLLPGWSPKEGGSVLFAKKVLLCVSHLCSQPRGEGEARNQWRQRPGSLQARGSTQVSPARGICGETPLLGTPKTWLPNHLHLI